MPPLDGGVGGDSGAAAGPDHNFRLPQDRLDEIKKLSDEYDALEVQRDSINADMNAKRKLIKACGVNLDAWRATRIRQKMDPEVRAIYDAAAGNCALAFGIPVQGDLFAESGDGSSLPSGLKH